MIIGNDFRGITIHSSEVLQRAKDNEYPIVEENEQQILISPDGYKFFIINDAALEDTG